MEGVSCSSKKGKVYLYRTKIDEIQAKKSMVQDLLARAFDGSESHLIASLLQDREVRRDELTEIRRLIDEEKGEGEDE